MVERVPRVLAAGDRHLYPRTAVAVPELPGTTDLRADVAIAPVQEGHQDGQQLPPRVLTELGNIRLRRGDFEGAEGAYRRRLLEIEEDVEDATRDNDLGRIALAQADREFLVGELSRAVGVDGRPQLGLSTAGGPGRA